MKDDRKKAIEKADKIISDIIKREECLFCKRQAEPHHFIKGRVNLKYRWDLRNIAPLCRIHHRDSHDGKISEQDILYRMLYYDRISIEEYYEIKNDNSINKVYTYQIEDFIKGVRKNV